MSSLSMQADKTSGNSKIARHFALVPKFDSSRKVVAGGGSSPSSRGRESAFLQRFESGHRPAATGGTIACEPAFRRRRGFGAMWNEPRRRSYQPRLVVDKTGLAPTFDFALIAATLLW